jgi:hypothetical protein
VNSEIPMSRLIVVKQISHMFPCLEAKSLFVINCSISRKKLHKATVENINVISRSKCKDKLKKKVRSYGICKKWLRADVKTTIQTYYSGFAFYIFRVCIYDVTVHI